MSSFCILVIQWRNLNLIVHIRRAAWYKKEAASCVYVCVIGMLSWPNERDQPEPFINITMINDLYESMIYTGTATHWPGKYYQLLTLCECRFPLALSSSVVSVSWSSFYMDWKLIYNQYLQLCPARMTICVVNKLSKKLKFIQKH